jgi:hypothetical protein
MEARRRRLFAFLGGCVIGVGLGVLASGLSSIANYYLIQYMMVRFVNVPDIGTAPTVWVWIACLIIGAGLGVALAAMIPNDPAPDLE